MKKQTKEGNCFIITPIGDSSSEIRRNTDGLISTVIRPLLKEKFSFNDIKAAHEINASGSINNQIMKRILYDDLVIANLTGVNPNVMYELAVRHATLKPVIHICEIGTKLPFDIVDQRTIFYKNDMLGVQELKEQLEAMIGEAIENSEIIDNPVYNASQNKIFIESVSQNPEKNFEKYLLERFDKLESKILGNQQMDSEKQTFKYSEPFKIHVVTNYKVDKEYIQSELKIGLERINYTIILFKIDGQRQNKDSFETWINIIVSSNLSVPVSEEIYNIFNHMSLTEFKEIEVDGNVLPF